MNFELSYSMVFGGIFFLSLFGNYHSFVPDLAMYGVFVIWIGGLAVYHLMVFYSISIKGLQNYPNGSMK